MRTQLSHAALTWVCAHAAVAHGGGHPRRPRRHRRTPRRQPLRLAGPGSRVRTRVMPARYASAGPYRLRARLAGRDGARDAREERSTWGGVKWTIGWQAAEAMPDAPSSARVTLSRNSFLKPRDNGPTLRRRLRACPQLAASPVASSQPAGWASGSGRSPALTDDPTGWSRRRPAGQSQPQPAGLPYSQPSGSGGEGGTASGLVGS